MKSAITGLFCFFLSLGLLSCYREPKIRGSFLFTGRVVEECSGQPIANQYIQLNLEVSPDYTPQESIYSDLGHGTTDVNGNFSFECPRYKTGLPKSYALTWQPGYYAPGAGGEFFDDDLDVVDVGTLYRRILRSKYTLILRRPYQLSDTLYIGLPFYLPTRTVYPIVDSQIIVQEYLSSSARLVISQNWGLGIAQYDSAVAGRLRSPQTFPTEFFCDTLIRSTVVVLE